MKLTAAAVFALFLVLCTYTAQAHQTGTDGLASASEKLRLRMVQVVTRHGDRSPLHKLPNDTNVWICRNNLLEVVNPLPPNNKFQKLPVGRLYEHSYLGEDELFLGNCSTGQLTEKGAQQHYALGSAFRSLYVDKHKLLSPTFNPEEVYVRSTDITRTKLSAQSQLLGLYPDNTLGAHNIIRINLLNPDTEFMYPNSGFCPQVSAAIKAVAASPAWVEHAKQSQPLYDKLAAVFGTNKLGSWSNLMDSFNCLLSHNKPLPKGVTMDMVNGVFANAGWEMGAQVNNTQYATYGIGEFVGRILENMLANVKKPTYKFILYSGHDTTVGPLLGALGVFDNVWPPYASHVEFELYESESMANDYYVKVSYNNKDLRLPGCSNVYCRLDDFKAHVRPIIPLHWFKDCQAAAQHAK